MSFPEGGPLLIVVGFSSGAKLSGSETERKLSARPWGGAGSGGSNTAGATASSGGGTNNFRLAISSADSGTSLRLDISGLFRRRLRCSLWTSGRAGVLSVASSRIAAGRVFSVSALTVLNFIGAGELGCSGKSRRGGLLDL